MVLMVTNIFTSIFGWLMGRWASISPEAQEKIIETVVSTLRTVFATFFQYHVNKYQAAQKAASEGAEA
jgi:hypothetical protein